MGGTEIYLWSLLYILHIYTSSCHGQPSAFRLELNTQEAPTVLYAAKLQHLNFTRLLLVEHIGYLIVAPIIRFSSVVY